MDIQLNVLPSSVVLICQHSHTMDTAVLTVGTCYDDDYYDDNDDDDDTNDDDVQHGVLLLLALDPAAAAQHLGVPGPGPPPSSPRVPRSVITRAVNDISRNFHNIRRSPPLGLLIV